MVFFDSRILDFDAKPEEITTTDKKYMNVDSYTKWRIVDPLTFYTKVRTVQGAQARLDDIVRSQLRVALGRYTLIEVVSHKRQEIMDAVTGRSRELLQPYGIDILDVRIKRTDLPAENARAIFGRMKAERERQAKQYRSEGREASARIIAEADKERTIILADRGQAVGHRSRRGRRPGHEDIRRRIGAVPGLLRLHAQPGRLQERIRKQFAFHHDARESFPQIHAITLLIPV